MKKLFALLLMVLMSSAFIANDESDITETSKIHSLLDNWHKAAAEANFTRYFSAMTNNAIFIGTDATENWNKAQFMAYAKPYFDKGKAWNFKRIERHVYFDISLRIAWFDELLETDMKICRGSGVLLKQNGEWKITQYVLSMTVPNANTEAVIKIKAPIEDTLIHQIKNLK